MVKNGAPYWKGIFFLIWTQKQNGDRIGSSQFSKLDSSLTAWICRTFFFVKIFGRKSISSYLAKMSNLYYSTFKQEKIFVNWSALIGPKNCFAPAWRRYCNCVFDCDIYFLIFLFYIFIDIQTFLIFFEKFYFFENFDYFFV